MKKDIVLAGVGGQGVISIAVLISDAALSLGLYCKQSEVHGMAQRGGAVTSHVRISDAPIYAGIIPKGRADVLLATEPMEALRYALYLSPQGAIISSRTPVENIDYDVNKVLKAITSLPRSRLIDALEEARKLGNPRAANIVLLGALIGELHIVGFKEAIVSEIKRRFAPKGEKVAESNICALKKGMSS